MADAQDKPAVAPAETTETPQADGAKVNGEATDGTAAEATNGDAKPTAENLEKAEPAPAIQETAPEGDNTAGEPAEGVEAATASTPASSKNKRKSTGGVPEHKSKKLNKKKSMPVLNLDLQPGDPIWARLKGFPPWPAIVADEDMLPESLLATRPVSTKRPDGTYREDYEEGGKNAKDRQYAVMFLATNEFAWMPNTSLTRLEASECENPEKKLTPSLGEAYKIATEAHDLDHFKGILRQHEQELQEYEAEQREKEERKAQEAAEKAEKKAEKERRKSKVDVDGTDVDGAEKPSKKRKKEADSDGEGSKAKKTPKVKLSAKEPKAESAKKIKPKKKAAKQEEPEVSEADRLASREKAIFYLRHRLQKCFLSSDTPPTEGDMPSMDEFFTQLEKYADLEASIIRQTKINKVLKNILRLETIPKDDEFNFKSRSTEMLKQWSAVLNAPEGGEEASSKAKPAANGDSAESKNGTGDDVDTTMTDAHGAAAQMEEAKAEEAKEGAEKTEEVGAETAAT